MEDADEMLCSVYRRQSVLDARNHPLSLPISCPKAVACWEGLRDQMPEIGACASELSPPYIGDRYHVGRVLIILENLSNYGGFDLGPEATKGMRYLGGKAKEELRSGLRLLFKSTSYRGTSVWSRAISYGACWLDTHGLLPTICEWTPEGDVATESLHESIDFLAIVQHIKCSPKDGNRSTPSTAMWRECGSHLLIHELPLLRPSAIIVLGTSKNAQALGKRVFFGSPENVREASVQTGKRRLRMKYEERTESWGRVRILFVPHPASPEGTSVKLIAAVRQMLKRG